MSMYRGPILIVAAPHEVQQRLSDARHARINGNAPSATAEYLVRRRETAAHLVDRGCRAASGWLWLPALRRAVLAGSLEQ